jgi:hypothetical protein
VDELQKVFERQIRELASGVLVQPQRPSLDCSAEAGMGVRLGRHEQMFA